MLTPDAIESNLTSWIRIRDFVEKFPDDETWKSWNDFMRYAIQTASDDGLNRYFRVGQSMQQMVFSTCDRHGLESFNPEPPRVTLVRGKNGMFVVISRSNLWFSTPDRQTPVAEDNVVSVLRSY